MKKTLALILAAMLCIGLFAACQSSTLEAYSGDDSTSEETDASATDTTDTTDTTEAETTDYTPCFESYDPDEVMMTINGLDVTWRELFYWYYYDVSSLEYYYGDITDWDDTSLFDGEQSYRDYVTTNALETVKHYCALESKAADMGIELTDEDRTTIDERWQSNVETYGGGDEDAFVEYLGTLFLDKDLYNHINEISALYDDMLEETYGADGSKLTEEEVLEKATDMGYSHAKHIYMSFYDDDSNELTDEEKAAKKAQLQTILDELKTITDPTALEAKIDEYTAEISEDPGKDYYPDGYTYLSGDLDDTFEAAVAEIGENELYPEIVESSMGYHIIYRLPLSATAAVEASDEGTYYTLAYYVAQDMFEALADQWAEESEVEYTKAYEKMDISKVFAKADTSSSDSDNDESNGADWYVIVIIVLLASAVAVGVILLIQHEKAGRAAQSEGEADADKHESGEEAAETEPADSAEENEAESPKNEEKPDEGDSPEEKKENEPEK